MWKKDIIVGLFLILCLAVSCEKEKAPSPVIHSADITLTPEAQNARVGYSIEHAVPGIVLAATTDVEWITDVNCTEEGVISFMVSLNEGDARTANMTLTYPDAEDLTIQVTQQAAGFSLALSQKSLSFVSKGGEITVNVTSDRPWTVTGGAEWVKASLDHGNNGESVTFSCVATRELDSRKTKFTFKCKGSETGMDLNVVQSELGRIIVEKASYNVPAESSDLTVTLQANTDVEVHVTGDQSSWVQLPVTKGMQTRKFIFKIAENPKNAVRSAIVQFKNADAAEQIEIIQAAMYPKNVADEISDPALKEYILKNYDQNADGKISRKEIEAISELILPKQNIQSIAGVEYMVHLKKLDLSNNHIPSADLTANRVLESVNLDSNRELKSLNLEGLNGLKELHAGWSSLENLNIRGADHLEHIILVGVKIPSIDLTSLKDLKRFIISGASFSNLDLSNNTELNYVSIDNRGLTSLDLSQNQKLTQVRLYLSPDLSDLKIQNLEHLEEVSLQGSAIKSLSLEKSARLRQLNLMECKQLQVLDVSKNYLLQNLDVLSCISIEKVIMFKGQEIKHIFGVSRGIITYVDFQYPEDCASEISDPVFRKYMLDHFDTDRNGKISKAEADFVTSINCPKMGIKAINGISYFENIREIVCPDNQITSLELLSLKKLEKLDAARNQIRQIDLSYCGLMKELYLQSNRLTTLEGVSELDKLIKVDLSRNEISGSFTFSFKTSMLEFDISHNQIEDIVVHECSSMLKFDCSYNKIRNFTLWSLKKMEDFNCSNNPVQILEAHKVVTLKRLNCSNTEIKTLNLAPNTSLQQLICKGCKDLSEVYVGENQIPDIQKDDHTAILKGQPK